MRADAKILLTGPTSQVGLPLARALAREHRVTGVARFSDARARATLEAEGVECLALDLAGDDLSALPRDFDYVLHFAVVKTGDWERDLTANAVGLGRLLSHCRDARALLHCSSGGVYAPPGDTPAAEDAPLGDNHKGLMPTYSICKIAAEAMARFAAREYDLPTTIARFSVPYGDNGGWPWYHLMMMKSGVPVPVHPQQPNRFNPIHEDDYIAQVPAMLDAARVPATIVNWAGHETVSIEEWCAYLGELTGLEPKFAPDENAIASLPLDTTRMHALVGETRVGWKDGVRRMVEARNPELLKG
ncbi:MAG: NAD-dependent epimerase/dehydratase family protein [Myxococcota bacterium]